MPRVAASFQLILRKDTGKKPIYYARFRKEDGELAIARSTGQTSKTAARAWADAQNKAGRISTRENITFERFAEEWWTPEHSYMKGKESRGRPISPGYADTMRIYLTRHILPYFREKKLAKITVGTIEKWVLEMKDKKSKRKTVFSETTVNHCLTCLKIMLGEAARVGIIPKNPAASVENLRETPKQKQILSIEELRALFQEDAIPTVWSGDLKHFTLNLLSASTGMRLGEVQGLQVRHVRSGYIEVINSWSRPHGLKDPKWNSAREIPIPSKTARYLALLTPGMEPDDLIFHGTRDTKIPIGHREILDRLYAVLAEIGLTEADRAARNITFHSWRFLFNSLCRSRVPDYKVQRLTGHRTQKMTEHYTRLNLADFQDVVALQAETFG